MVASSPSTGIRSVAEKAVVTGGRIIRIHATRLGITGVVGADVFVVAIGRRAAHTDFVGTGIVGGTSAPVVARRRIGCVAATGLRIAKVIGASVSIIANQRSAADAGAIITGIACGARVAIVARIGIGDMKTAVCIAGRIARSALVIRAGIAVIARTVVWRVVATARFDAAIVGAGHLIVATKGTELASVGRLAGIRRAGQPIAAHRRFVCASGLGIARIVRARVAIAAING